MTQLKKVRMFKNLKLRFAALAATRY